MQYITYPNKFEKSAADLIIYRVFVDFVSFADNMTQHQCDQIGQNFAILATFYVTNFHPNKQFQPVVCCKVSKIV